MSTMPSESRNEIENECTGDQNCKHTCPVLTVSEELRRLSEKATPGPWEVNTAHEYDKGKPWVIWGPKGPGYGCVANVVPYCPPATQEQEDEKEANANFIVACVNHVRNALRTQGQPAERKP